MIRLPTIPLVDTVATDLAALQQEITDLPIYQDRVQRAHDRFAAVNRRGNRTFDAIKVTLRDMCAGARRCMYCEDSMADEVEHFRPKAFYPELAFVWLNYLYSCGICNSLKRQRFRIQCGSGEYVDLARGPGEPWTEPASGVPVLIDPRIEDPLQYLGLDLLDTFRFVSKHAPGTQGHERASYTIACLKLNDRDDLARARAQAYVDYRARLREYLMVRGTATAAVITRALLRHHHPTVWAEMKAQSNQIVELRGLFEAAPEALRW